MMSHPDPIDLGAMRHRRDARRAERALPRRPAAAAVAGAGVAAGATLHSLPPNHRQQARWAQTLQKAAVYNRWCDAGLLRPDTASILLAADLDALGFDTTDDSLLRAWRESRAIQ